MTGPLYLDTSAVLRAVLESGVTPEIEDRIASAAVLITSRLSLVESARAMHRVRSMGSVSERQLADAQRDLARLWARCDVWELTEAVCRLASDVAPQARLRTLDALHLATFLHARERIPELELLTADMRMRRAAD
jgi:predicted nucleic acid-binding protein